MPLPSGDSTQGMTQGIQEVDGPNFNPYANIVAAPWGDGSPRVTDQAYEQYANAAIIVQVGRQMGLGTRDIQIALITAMTESSLMNLDHGDRDSLGLFQQRPSQGWGTPAQVQDPRYAAGKFYKALLGLGDRRYQMGMGEAAQAVQRSAYPERYATHIKAIRSMWPRILKTSGEQPQTVDGLPYEVEDRSWEDSPYVGNISTAAELAAGDTGQPATLAGPGLITGDGATSFGTGGALTEIVTPDAPTPTAHQLLGAWGMGNPTIQEPEPIEVPIPGDPFTQGAAPIISPATNASTLTAIQEETGDFAKGVDGWRKAVIAAARIALGTPYTWGGNSLQGGVDCSGLVQQAFARAGLTMPRVSYQQASRGARVGLDALRPGDLVAWDNSSRNNGADHIAIYLGNGQIIEAARPGTAVRVRSVSPDEGAWGVHLNF